MLKTHDVDEKQWISVYDVAIESPKYYDYVTRKDVGQETVERLKKLRQALTSRVLPSYTIGPEFEYEDVARIFLQMNSAGVKIGTVDMFFSLLASKFPKDFKENILKFHYSLSDSFGTSLRFVVRSLAAILGENQSNFKSARIRQAIDKLATDQGKLKVAWDKAEFYINEMAKILNDLGLDNDSYLPSENVLVPMVYYLSIKENKLSAKERNQLILWFLLSSFFGRYSASVDTRLDQDLATIKNDSSLTNLFINLKKRTGRLNIAAEDFKGKYKVNQLLLFLVAARANGATDWFGGTLISSKDASEQHIFPRAFLQQNKIEDSDMINDIANITILTLRANIHMGKNPPEEYFKRNYVGQDKIEKHFVPTNPDLWRIEKYADFLEERRKKMVSGIRDYLESLGMSEVEKEVDETVKAKA